MDSDALIDRLADRIIERLKAKPKPKPPRPAAVQPREVSELEKIQRHFAFLREHSRGLIRATGRIEF